MKRHVCGWAAALLLSASGHSARCAETRHDFARWEKEIAAFGQMDRTHPPPSGAVLFIGSSTIRRWKTLAQDFPGHCVINRGFGGSEIADAAHFADRIIFPYAPRMIFLRSGGNDLWRGRTPEQVFADFREFVAVIRSKLPDTEIVYISVNPTPARWKQREETRTLNALVEEFVRNTPGLKYIETWHMTLGTDGLPRPELFAKDRLHFNEAGYMLLADKVRPFLPPPDAVPRLWKQTGVLPAPEAVQAAAVDGATVYAIASDRIARYDRATGRRLAVSAGGAHHLNSGFVWKGKLYCAHSNFPQKPERSEIKVLAPRVMQPVVFKDFGEYGGSLTWAVRDEQFWWCHFACYGPENARSFLAKFDLQWKELARWLDPPELMSVIGGSSLSGGVWHDGALLVTDHDRRFLYRLCLPSEGGALRYVAREPSPFPGQGIAADPETGGLAGIDRKARTVIFAAPEPPCREQTPPE